ncbi:MAG TPA: hypothetical protein VF665_04360 [Longimicrobium sp.]|jgi:hypothetical protein|uniref:hypothetical protein n=1 Tax=Longimicrobium sp. TaxID=2029185 RepID=UPI002ED95FD0
MRHLNDETLARLVDEPAEPHEAEHLRDCLACRRELAELRAQTLALGELADPEPPAAAWTRLEARLRDEELVRGAAPARRGWIHLHGVRAAAAIALFLMGGAAGAALWSARGGPQPVALTQPQAAARTRPVPSFGEPDVIYDVPARGLMSPAPSAGSGARLASTAPADPQPPQRPARTADAAPPAAAPRAEPVRVTRGEAVQAARELVQAQAAYAQALQRYTSIADPASGNDAETRMAALDQLIELTGAALERTPEDPVINGYHLAATAERERLRREQARDAQTQWF